MPTSPSRRPGCGRATGSRCDARPYPSPGWGRSQVLSPGDGGDWWVLKGFAEIAWSELSWPHRVVHRAAFGCAPQSALPVGISVFFQTLRLAFISLLSSSLFLLLLSKMNGEQRANRHPETAYGRDDKGFLILFSCIFSFFKGKFDPNNPHRSINFAQKASLCLENIPRLSPAATNFYFIWEQESHLSSRFAGLTHWLGLGLDILQ